MTAEKIPYRMMSIRGKALLFLASFAFVACIHCQSWGANHTTTKNEYPDANSVIALFSIDIAYGCSPLKVNILNQSVGATSYLWDFGDDNTSTTHSASFSNTWVNYTDAPKTFDLKLTASDGATSDTRTVQITVLPAVQTAITTDATSFSGCAPHAIVFEHSSENAESFLWNFGDGNISASANPQHIYQNSETDIKPFKVLLTASSPSYEGTICIARDSVNVSIKPQVTASFDHLPVSGCSPIELSIVNASTGADTHTWNFNDGNPTFINNALELSQTLTNTTPEDKTFTIELTSANTFGCTNITSRNVTVHALPVAAFQPSQTIACNPALISFTNQSTGSASWQWDFENQTTSGEFEPANILFSHSQTKDTVVYNVRLTALTDRGCQNTSMLPVTIATTPSAGFSISHDDFCSTNGVATAKITNQSIKSDRTHWTISNNVNDQVLSFDNHQAQFDLPLENTTSQPITFTITQTAGNPWGCESQTSRSVTVFPTLYAKVQTVESGCHPLAVDFSHQSSLAVNWRWEFADGTISFDPQPEKIFHNFSQTESLDIHAKLYLESEFGCTHDTIIFFEVYPKPVANFTLPMEGCSPFETQMADLSIVSGNDDYSWSFSPGTELFNAQGFLVHQFINNESAPVENSVSLTVTNEFGCSHKRTKTINILPRVMADFSISQISGCHPLVVSLTNHSTGADAASPYLWNYGNGTSTTTETQHSRTFINTSHTDPQDFTISLRATSSYGCVDTASRQVNVYPVPLALYQPSAIAICSPDTVLFKDLSLGSQLDYLWTFMEGETSTQKGDTSFPYFIASNGVPATHQTSLRITNSFGCAHTHNQSLTVYPQVKAIFSGTAEGCDPLEIAFQNNSTGHTQLFWNFGNGNQSTMDQPRQIFYNTAADQTAEYQVRLTATSQWGCESNSTQTIKVFPNPQVSFTLDNNRVCSPHITTFSNLSAGVTQYAWSFGNGTSSTGEQTFTRLFENSGYIPDTIHIELVGQNDFSCMQQSATSLIVYPEVKANFRSLTDTYSGCSPLQMQFDNQSEKSINYRWNMGDLTASEAPNPEHVFVSLQYRHTHYKVKLEAVSAYGCIDSLTREVTVFAQPSASFEALPFEQFFPDRTITIENYTGEGDWSFRWDLGDGYRFEAIDSEPFSHTYQWDEGENTTQHYTIRLEAFNEHCRDEAIQQVSVKAVGPVSAFEAPEAGCPPLEIQFVNKSYFATQYYWDFGDGNISQEEKPMHVYMLPGRYEVSLTVTGETGTGQTSRIITVLNPPAANFSVEPNPVVLPGDWAQMINLSSNSHAYHWDFGDGNSSDQESPMHYYNKPGTYTIELTAFSDTDPQCRDQISGELQVATESSLSDCYLYFPNAFTPNPSGPNGGTYQLGDPANNVFHPKHQGITEFSMQIFNRWGNKIFESDDINVGWDGYLRETLMPMGVYVYKAQGKCSGGEMLEKKGDLTLVR
jgi:gliding motility-associated-like protein